MLRILTISELAMTKEPGIALLNFFLFFALVMWALCILDYPFSSNPIILFVSERACHPEQIKKLLILMRAKQKAIRNIAGT